MSSFTANAAKLCGKCALLLGWRPSDFWDATPAELETILSAITPEAECPPEPQIIEKLKEQFPDG
ncbi:phage tail assembly chaperone [Sphingorhabdus arenilitoris]|uniref:Phage tail assembly chaperone n=1 Tax=Sphingorhabdus arenilitoris TaxID=1490041 RepID=A0ABV8RG97_9SPHN